MKRLLITSLLSLSSLVQAQEIYLTSGVSDHFYRVGPVTTSFNNGLVITTWIKMVNIYEKKYNMGKTEIHCPTGMFRILQSQDYVNGGFPAQGYVTPNAPWTSPIPGAVSANFISICP